MNDNERKAFYEAEGKSYRPQAIEEFGDFCIKYPYKQDMPRYQFATKWLLEEQMKMLALPAHQRWKMKILDIGCQNGAFDVGWANLGFDVTAIDISDDYLEITSNSLKKFSWHSDWRVIKADIAGDISQIKQHGPFDFIMALEVVEHLSDLDRFFNAVNQLCVSYQPRLVINVPGENSWADDDGHLLSFWDKPLHVDAMDFSGRYPHVVPKCFERDGWRVIGNAGEGMATHDYDGRNFWHAVALKK